jgi:D-glycerate 3-kinase
MTRMTIPNDRSNFTNAVTIAAARIREGLASAHPPIIVGLCGAQGSGKSTLADALSTTFENSGVSTAVLSIDDLYLTKSERRCLSRNIHPLLATRGVPGTHDIALGLQVLDDLKCGRESVLPRFDKSIDDRAPADTWPQMPAGTELLILEGWCVGARAEHAAALVEPVNELEREHDPNGLWRTYVNEALAGAYQQLFAAIDIQIMLAAPSFDVVKDWRTEQEHALIAKVGGDAPGTMSDAEVGMFIQHYERITRHILGDMPRHADLVIALDGSRAVVGREQR